MHRVAEKKQDGLVLSDLLEIARVIEDRVEVAYVGVQVADDDELPFLGLRELDQAAGPSIGGTQAQRGIEGKNLTDGFLERPCVIGRARPGIPRALAYVPQIENLFSPSTTSAAALSASALGTAASLLRVAAKNFAIVASTSGRL